MPDASAYECSDEHREDGPTMGDRPSWEEDERWLKARVAQLEAVLERVVESEPATIARKIAREALATPNPEEP